MKIEVKREVLSENDAQAQANASRLAEAKLIAVNVLASPGAGKTSLIIHLLKRLPEGVSGAVIEGDVAGSLDTDNIRRLGYPAEQINTGGGCHLDAAMVAGAMDRLGARGPGFVFIENIGNLICPVSYRLGEKLRLVVASVAEGDDKPVKYPAAFASADAIVLNKTDLAPHVEFRMDFFLQGVKTLNPAAPVFRASCRGGEGIDAVAHWLLQAAKLGDTGVEPVTLRV
jgi:hydrogenase nickel incorporation protein HypB